MRKIFLIIISFIITITTFFKFNEFIKVKKKINVIIENFTEKDYVTFEDWSVFNRGFLELWRRTDDGGIGIFYVFQNKLDTNILWVPVNGKYDSKYIINIDTTIARFKIAF